MDDNNSSDDDELTIIEQIEAEFEQFEEDFIDND